MTPETTVALDAAGLDADTVERAVRAALDEDFRYGPDVTSAATVGELAACLKSTLASLYCALRLGKLRGVKIGTQRRIDLEDKISVCSRANQRHFKNVPEPAVEIKAVRLEPVAIEVQEARAFMHIVRVAAQIDRTAGEERGWCPGFGRPPVGDRARSQASAAGDGE